MRNSYATMASPCMAALLMLGIPVATQVGTAAETEVQQPSDLTAVQKNTINGLLEKALGHPRADGPRALAAIAKIGPGALIYASRETSKLLYIPLEVNPDSGNDLLLMQVRKNLRTAERMDERTLQKLKEIVQSGNKDHVAFAELVVSIQEHLPE